MESFAHYYTIRGLGQTEYFTIYVLQLNLNRNNARFNCNCQVVEKPRPKQIRVVGVRWRDLGLGFYPFNPASENKKSAGIGGNRQVASFHRHEWVGGKFVLEGTVVPSTCKK